jgi:subtilisin family serine protease
LPAAFVTPLNADDVPSYSQERPGTFVDMPDSLLWGHITHSGHVAIVGLRKPGRNRGVYRGRVLMDRSQWEQSRHAVTSASGVELIWADTLLPTVKVRFASFDAFVAVRRLPMSDYIEPLRAIGDLPPHAEGSLGCNNLGQWNEERLYTPEGDVYSLKHRRMGIEAAWRRTNGSGVNVGVIDTGIHGSQTQLMPGRLVSSGRFDAGASAGRWYKFRDAWTGNAEPYPQDQCGHGTETAGVIAAPRDGFGPVGVAWKSNLVATRIANGVVNVNSDDAQHGIRNTLSAMEGEPGPKIVSMSWQSMNWWWQVSNEIDYWKGRYPSDLLFFGAAGTSLVDWQECTPAALGLVTTFWNPYAGLLIFLGGSVVCGAGDNRNVVFPAEHPGVVAVTCADFSTGAVSNDCHYGSKVEFSAYRRFPTVHGSAWWVDGVGGSSGATPTVAGQAALVWSRYPYMTGSQILDRMRWAAQPRNDKQGYGIVNTYKAVGGIHWAAIYSEMSGGGFNEVAYYSLRVDVEGGDGPFTYLWENGATTRTRSAEVGPGEPDHRYRVAITDHSDGSVVYAEAVLKAPSGGCADPSQVICDSP